MAGLTLSDDFPTVKPLQRARTGGTTNTSPDAFVARIDHPLEIAADLSITQSGAPESIVTGTDFVYTLTVSNAGPSTATGTLVTDTLPASVSFVSAAPADQCALIGNTVQCNLGDVAKGSSATVKITVTGMVAGSAVNSATVTSNVPRCLPVQQHDHGDGHSLRSASGGGITDPCYRTLIRSIFVSCPLPDVA